MTYRRRSSPLHATRAGVGSLYCVVLAGVALSFEHPLILAALLLAVMLAAAGAQVLGPVARSLLWGLPFALVIAGVNALVVRDGLTVIARFGELPPLGQIDVTLEATTYGGVLALRALIVIACFALHSAAVDPDELLRAFRRLSFRSALTAALATRMVPVLARDARRFRDAQRCRPGPPASRLALARAVTAGALDRAVDVAATLEVRGYGGSGRPARRVRPWSRHDLAFAISAAALAALGAAAALGGWETFEAYPRLVVPVGGAELALAAALCLRRPAPVRRPQGDRPMSELVLERVTYSYPGAERPALADVSLRIEPGEFVVLAGGSGSGKSTLLRAAAGLVPHFHGGEFAGRLVAGGLDSREHGPAELSAVAGSLFQDPETQVVMGTVRAELAFPLENRGWGAAAVARGVEEAALALGVAGLLDRSTHELSGGELQRVALGAALAGRPRLLLLDEPTSQLDPVAGDELLGVLRRVNEEWGTAVVLAEHRLERCLAAADRVIALEDGAISIDADPRGFLEQAPPALQTPGARLFAAAGITPPPVAVKDARAALRARGLGGTAEGVGPGRRSASSRSPASPAEGPRRARLRRRLARDPARAGGAAGRGPLARAGRAGRADGAQRGGQVDAAAARRRADAADPRPDRARRPRLAAAAEPRRLPGRRAGGGGAVLRSARGRRPRLTLRAPPARPVRRPAPAARARHRPAGRAARRGLPRRADPRHGPLPQGRAGRTPARAGAAGISGARRDPRRRVRRAVGGADRAARRRRAGRRRADRRGARRRLVLRDPDRPHPRWLRAAPRGRCGVAAAGVLRTPRGSSDEAEVVQ